MAEIIRMPRMSDTMEEGVIVGWLKEVGDEVEPGDILAEVETDKATMELESYHEGVLLHIGVKEGPVQVNGILAVIGEKGEDYKEALAAAEAESASAGTESGSSAQVEVETVEEAPVNLEAPAVVHSSDTRIKASPLAKKMAADAGINLAAVAGSGDHGRIVKKDIQAYLSRNGSTPAPVAAPAAKSPAPASPPVNIPKFDPSGLGRQDTTTPVSQMRKVIARRLGESKFSAPHFYLTIEMEMSNTIAARKQMNEVAPVKISFNDIIVKGCAIALRQHPAINSSWLGDTIRTNGNINIGVAVAVDEGLLVPVINHADMKSLSQINTEVKELAGLARERRLQPDQMSGNTFTISNLGMFGIDEFTAIINPPDSCILAVGGIIQKPIVKDGQVTVGNMMKVTLSCDHRVVDGATGAKFLNTLKAILENPVTMLV